MKIAFTGNMFPFGEGLAYGGERILYYLLKTLAHRGHDLYLFAQDGCSIPTGMVKDYIRVPHLDGKTDFHLDAVQKYLIDHPGLDFDIYQCNYFTDGWRKEALTVAKGYVELVWCRWCHISWQLGLPAHNTISYSYVLQKQFFDTGPPPGVPTTMIHYGIPRFYYRPNMFPEKYAVWLGKIEGGKNPLMAIKLAKAAGIPLVLMGPPYNINDWRAVMPYVDNKTVFWVRGVDDRMKEKIMSKAVCFISSNVQEWTELFGIVNIEALAMGTPVLGFTYKGSPSGVKTDGIVKDGVSGYLLEYDDANDEQEIIGKGLPLLNEIVKIPRCDVRKHFNDNFTAELMADRYEWFYNRVAAGEMIGYSKPPM